MNIEKLAFDRATVRRIDADGRMHVAISAISKANVCPYFGREIPNSEALGLEPDQIYQLYRDPGELAKAVSTFNNIPLLNQHIAVSADQPQKESVVGATGSDAAFNDPFLSNSLVIWDSSAIAGIQTNEQRELSSAYRYVADMTPGVAPDGTPYHGRMTELVGNHVALVPVGRVGADILVGDSLPKELHPMKLSKKSAAARAALGAYLLPQLAQDGALPKIRELTQNVKSLEKLAADAAKAFPEADAEKLKAALKFALDEAEDVPVPPGADDEDDEDKDKDKAKDEDDEDKDKKPPKANDEDDESKDKDKDKKPAMDAALISQIRSDARRDAVSQFQAIRQAEADVRPLVGEIAALDSAEAVYRFAMDSLGIEHKGVHASAFPALIKMHKANQEPVPRIAQDSAHNSDFAKRFPTAGKVMKV